MKKTMDTIDDPFVSHDGLMKQYEVSNIPQVAHKVAELTSTRLNREYFKDICNSIKKSNSASDTVDYTMFDKNDNEIDISVFLGYHEGNWYVGIIAEPQLLLEEVKFKKDLNKLFKVENNTFAEQWLDFIKQLSTNIESDLPTELNQYINAFSNVADNYTPETAKKIFESIGGTDEYEVGLLSNEIVNAAEEIENGTDMAEVCEMALNGELSDTMPSTPTQGISMSQQ